MSFLKRTASSYSLAPPLEVSTTLSTPSESPCFESDSESSSWELLTTLSTPPDSRHVTPLWRTNHAPVLSDCSSFDATTFPAESYMYPSDQNGTWRTETLHALRHPTATASSFNNTLHRHATTLDWPTLCLKLQDLADSASEDINTRLNRAFQGHDVVEMSNRVVDLISSVSMPNMRQISQTLDVVSDAAQSLNEYRCSEKSLPDSELQGDQWAFARILSVKARRALVRQKICKEWQIMPTQANIHWQSQLNSALAALFTAEKHSSSITSLFSMTPIWKTDKTRGVWALELDTGLTEIVAGPGSEEFGAVPICLPVGFELPKTYGGAALAGMD